MDKGIIGLVMSLVVGTILIGSLLVPIIIDVQDTQKTVINNTASGKFSNFYGSDLDTLTAEIVLDNYSDLDFNVTVNGESYTVSATARESMIMSDKLFVRADPRNSGINIMYASMTSNSEAIKSVTLPLVVTISGNTINVKDSGTVDITESNNSWVFIPDSHGNYELVSSDSTAPIYLNNSDQVYVSTYIVTNNLGWISGNGANLKFVNSGIETDLILTDFEKDSRYNDLIVGLAGNVDINPEVGNNSDGTNFTPFFIMIPRYIDVHTDSNNSVISLVSAIPVIFLVALISLAAFAVVRR